MEAEFEEIEFTNTLKTTRSRNHPTRSGAHIFTCCDPVNSTPRHNINS